VLIEKAERVDRLIDRAPGELPLVGQIKQILAHLFIGELIRREPIELGQMINVMDVGFLRSLGQTPQNQFLDELLA
jgi:hypothetical protein